MYEQFIESLRNSPIGSLIIWIDKHPRLAAWIVLSTGMITLIILEARNLGLQVGQWAALIISTVLVAGLCVWIISFEDEADTAT